MPLALHDVRLVDVSIGTSPLQRIHLQASLAVKPIAIVGSIEGAAPNHERRVEQVLQPNISRMPSHHARRCPMVCHTRRHSPHAIATCRIAHDINLIGIDIVMGNHGSDEDTIHAVNGLLTPHVPSLEGRTRRHIHALAWTIQSHLVAPLLVVHFRRRPASSMQANPQASSVDRFISIDRPPQLHAVAVLPDDAVADDVSSCSPQAVKPQMSNSLIVLCKGRHRKEKEGKEKSHGFLIWNLLDCLPFLIRLSSTNQLPDARPAH